MIFKKFIRSHRIRRTVCSLACAVTTFTLAISPAYASILGDQTSHSEAEYAQGTVYNRNTFESSSVGQQTENYFEYTPNSDVLPIISNGSSVYGRRTVLQANEYLNEQGIFAAMGMNADFFSFKTGVPMSDTIVDGHVLTADEDELIGLGFNSDGTAFITRLGIDIALTDDEGNYFDIECLNKYRQPYVMYMYTDEYGDDTAAEGTGTNIVLGDVSGEFVLGQPVTATVESITHDDGAVSIPDGKLVISVDDGVADEVKARLDVLSVGEKVTITASETTGDERWYNAVYGTGCLGGSLILDGELNYEDDIAAPRSAVGIRSDGSIIFYTIDGRQTGYSYGARKETVARRLLELGCVDAVNLDGGGSTQLAGTLPETTEMTVLNNPSEELRSCANFIFLKKTNAPDGIPYKLLTYPYGENVLTGSTVGIWVSAIDKSYGTATLTEPVTYTVTSGDAVIDSSGYVTLYGEGDIYINSASGDAQGSTVLYSIANPDSIAIKNEGTGETLSDITLGAGESILLTADAEYSGETLTSNDDAYTWSISDAAAGSITGDGTFTAGYTDGTYTIGAAAGTASAEINVTVTTENVPTPTPTARPAETDYPSIVCSVSGSKLTAKIFGTHGTLTADNITLTMDGKAQSFELSDDGTLTFDASSGVHQIAITVTDSEGYSAFKTCTTGELSSLENVFDDTASHWAKDYISYMSGRNVISGYSEDGETLFKPDKNMTRAEFACMIVNYLGINVYNYRGTELPFDDTDSIPDWAMMQVQSLYALGIMNGQQNGDTLEFSPNGNIKRSEYSAAIARMLPDGLYYAELNAVDGEDVPAWAKSSIELLCSCGIMNGYTDGSIRPNNYVTRAEAIKMLFALG